MHGIPQIRFCFKLLVEELLAAARFITRHQQDCLSLWVEGEGGTPLAIGSPEARFLHIIVSRPFGRVGVRTTKLRAIIVKQLGNSQQFAWHLSLEGQKFHLEGIV